MKPRFHSPPTRVSNVDQSERNRIPLGHFQNTGFKKESDYNQIRPQSERSLKCRSQKLQRMDSDVVSCLQLLLLLVLGVHSW